jgi:thioredoxin reductase (NADPH)
MSRSGGILAKASRLTPLPQSCCHNARIDQRAVATAASRRARDDPRMPGTALPLEALVIGAGPAGLTAAVYLARFRRRLLLVDAGRSRAHYIPVSHNTPGFASGIHGDTLLERLREQAATYGVDVRAGRVEALAPDDGGFVATIGGQRVTALRVILATGVVDVLPAIDGVEPAIRAGVIRLCPICDGYETDGRRVAVFGPPASAASHARFMRTFCADVTAITEREFSAEQRADLDAIGIACIDHCGEIVWDGRKEVRVACAGGNEAGFDVFYPVLGARAQSQLAQSLGAQYTKEGDLIVDAHQRTSVPGLYAIGDVVSALNQISVGVGHAAIAATDLHNSLPYRAREA